ncbi:MAG: MarR family transcriptional regulator [Sphingobacteriaceae bacterium]|nr:MAG: MarR family transcriptional regulator [Sphingobacteriaceae bacterium]
MNFGEDLSLQVMLAHKSYQSYLNSLLKKNEVYQHYHILLLLSRMGGKSTQKVLGTELLIEKSNMVAIIDLLIDKGYVVRDINYKDRRSKLISLTPKGVEMVNKLNQSLATIEETIVEDITWQELYNCLRVLTKVNDKFKVLTGANTAETAE